jgi:hypothetical protein
MAQNNQEGSEKITALLRSCPRVISYKGILNEVSPEGVFSQVGPLVVHTIQPIASLVPEDEVATALRAVAGHPALVFIPGRLFDDSGTRHGKGFGWYDRFLSMAPSEWIRVGMCYDDHFSNTPLVRQPWDEPMDFVCVVSRESEAITCHETFARTTSSKG